MGAVRHSCGTLDCFKGSLPFAGRGVRSIWTQLVVQALAIKHMRLSAADPHCHVPVFGGDFNDHQVLHHEGEAELHIMQHPSTKAGKKTAVACMRHLVAASAARTQSGVLSLWPCINCWECILYSWWGKFRIKFQVTHPALHIMHGHFS